MKLIYKKKPINVTVTNNPNLLKYHFQKLYYAIIIKNCNSYSSVANKQRIDVVFVDEQLKIISVKKEMHENTIVKNDQATTAILLPLNYFEYLEVGTFFEIEDNL